MKLATWTYCPSAHLNDFHSALRDAGVDLVVRYLKPLPRYRLEMGWSEANSLPTGEKLLKPNEHPLTSVPDAVERVHIVPGYAYRAGRRVESWLSASHIPWVHWSEASQPTWKSKLLSPLKWRHARRVNRYALGAFAQGDHAVKDFVRWGIDLDRIAHLYYSCEPATAPEPDPELLSWLAGRRAVAFLGSLIPLKDPFCLLRSFAMVASDRNDTVLVYIGDGPLADSLRREADRLGIGDRVRVHGFVPMSKTHSLLRCCSTLVLPSRYDGWGMVLNEGAAAELALIASDAVGAGPHLISPGENGAVFRRGDSRALARALAPYINNPDLAHRAGVISRSRLADFSPSRNAGRCLSAIQTWLAGDDRWSGFRERKLARPVKRRAC